MQIKYIYRIFSLYLYINRVKLKRIFSIETDIIKLPKILKRQW